LNLAEMLVVKSRSPVPHWANLCYFTSPAGLWNNYATETTKYAINLLVFGNPTNKDFGHFLLGRYIRRFNWSFTQNWHCGT